MSCFDFTPPSLSPDEARRAQLLVDGKIYNGWKTFSVLRSIEAASGSFDLSVSDCWPGQTDPWPIAPGDECQLNLGAFPLIAGYVDSAEWSLSGGERGLGVKGRDKSADLVDCSYVDKPDQWRAAEAAQIAQDLARPYGLTVTAAGAPGEVKNFKIEQGETAWEALTRLCDLKGLLVYPDGRGGLEIGPPGTESVSAAIDERQVISLRVTDDHKERYSRYLVKGQRPTTALGRDAAAAKAANQTKDEAQDPGVSRYRPLMILSKGAGAEAREQAAWEAASRAGRGFSCEAVLPGYHMPGGELWPLNRLVSVNAPGICLSATLLIKSVKFDLGAQGHTATLSLCRPDAYKPEPVKAPKGGGGAGGGLPEGTVIIE